MAVSTRVTSSLRSPDAEFLVIGSGVAGLRAAIELSRHGRVLMLTKGNPLESSSIYAQGGVAVARYRETVPGGLETDVVRYRWERPASLL